jgi:(p)ppGpp synthase/HD superfamily hydrolase
MYNTLYQTLMLAQLAHLDQVDKAGKPYIMHPVRVMTMVSYNRDAMHLGLLHDVLEDTAVTRAELEPYYPRSIMMALDAITHPKHEPLDDYYARVREDPLATHVKIADLRDHINRLHLIQDAAVRTRLTIKYNHAAEVFKL